MDNITRRTKSLPNRLIINNTKATSSKRTPSSGTRRTSSGTRRTSSGTSRTVSSPYRLIKNIKEKEIKNATMSDLESILKKAGLDAKNINFIKTNLYNIKYNFQNYIQSKQSRNLSTMRFIYKKTNFNVYVDILKNFFPCFMDLEQNYLNIRSKTYDKSRAKYTDYKDAELVKEIFNRLLEIVKELFTNYLEESNTDTKYLYMFFLNIIFELTFKCYCVCHYEPISYLQLFVDNIKYPNGESLFILPESKKTSENISKIGIKGDYGYTQLRGSTYIIIKNYKYYIKFLPTVSTSNNNVNTSVLEKNDSKHKVLGYNIPQII